MSANTPHDPHEFIPPLEHSLDVSFALGSLAGEWYAATRPFDALAYTDPRTAPVARPTQNYIPMEFLVGASSEPVVALQSEGAAVPQHAMSSVGGSGEGPSAPEAPHNPGYTPQQRRTAEALMAHIIETDNTGMLQHLLMGAVPPTLADSVVVRQYLDVAARNWVAERNYMPRHERAGLVPAISRASGENQISYNVMVDGLRLSAISSGYGNNSMVNSEYVGRHAQAE